jgi:flagellar biogenesis protein FliO
LEYVDLARFVFSLIAVIALILLCVWIAKRLDIEKRLAGLRKNSHLSVVESFHVLLIGQGSSLHIETYEASPKEIPDVAR